MSLVFRTMIAALLCAACTGTAVPEPAPTRSPLPPSPSPSRTAAQDDAPIRSLGPTVSVERMLALIERLVVAPREATSRSYRRAAGVVAGRLDELGYDVARIDVEVPAGSSWGIAVPAGRTVNVIATPPGFRSRDPHVVVGAHLDTVPQAPGANDNASGVAVMLELAALAAREPVPVPIVFAAFGAEEPRQPAGGYFGSRAYVASLGPRERGAVVGMLSLDRVGIGDTIRVCTTRAGSAHLAARFMAAARAHDEPARRCANRTSDHASFVEVGIAGVRLLGAEHPTYHTAGDTLDVIDAAQLVRMTVVAWRALASLG